MFIVIQDKQGNMSHSPSVDLLSIFHKGQVSGSGLFVYVTFSEHLWWVDMSPADLNSEIDSSM